MLTILAHIPAGLLEANACDLHTILPGPTLIHLPGRREPPLFVSALLHGNEDVGLQALQRVLKKHHELPRALSLFIGNISAAQANVRRLENQPDYNRVWQPSGDPTPEHRMVAQVVDEMARRRVFASIDLHNNTGHNPHYACVTELRHPDLHLAALFSRTVVYFKQPAGVQTMAFSPLCPSITCECGKVGDESGYDHAAELIEACLHLAEHPTHPVPPGDLHLFYTFVTAKVVPGHTVTFDNSPADLQLAHDIEWLNFRELNPGFTLARTTNARALKLTDASGSDRTADYLAHDGASLRLTRPVMPSMLTTNIAVIHQDCLGYFMERIPLPA